MSDTPAESHFAPSYAQARQQFLAAAAAAGLPVQSHVLGLPGQDGEELAMDVARAGPEDARALLLVTSACHGVEGYCGSGVQHALLTDPAFAAQARAAGVAVLYVHALNPHGFSWWRRTTEDNVDLNRNWHDFSRPLPANAGYEAIADLILPPQWPPSPAVEGALAAYAQQHGPRALQTAITAGQHTHPQGLFYGGRSATWSQRTFRTVLRQHGTRCARLGWIDVHTGLGPMGVGERIFACADDAAALARAQAWWGAGITSVYDGSSTSALLSGLMWQGVYDECPQAEYTGIALEFGTLPLQQMIAALREDQWHESHPQAPAQARAAARRRMLEAFYVDTPEWKAQVLAQATQAARQAVAGLS